MFTWNECRCFMINWHRTRWTLTTCVGTARVFSTHRKTNNLTFWTFRFVRNYWRKWGCFQGQVENNKRFSIFTSIHSEFTKRFVSDREYSPKFAYSVMLIENRNTQRNLWSNIWNRRKVFEQKMMGLDAIGIESREREREKIVVRFVRSQRKQSDKRKKRKRKSEW